MKCWRRRLIRNSATTAVCVPAEEARTVIGDDQGKIDFDDEFDGVDNGNDDSDDNDDDNGPEQSAGPLVDRCLFDIVKFLSKFTLKVNSSLLVTTLRMGRDLSLTSSLHEATPIPLKQDPMLLTSLSCLGTLL